MNYRDKIRKSIECPQLCNSSYGEWGSLRIDQKRNIKRLLDELDSADDYIKKLYKEKQELIDYLKKEQDRLARECSPIYEDDLGKHRLVNEEIYNEVSKILSKIERSKK